MSHWPGCDSKVVKVDNHGAYCALCGKAIRTVFAQVEGIIGVTNSEARAVVAAGPLTGNPQGGLTDG